MVTGHNRAQGFAWRPAHPRGPLPCFGLELGNLRELPQVAQSDQVVITIIDELYRWVHLIQRYKRAIILNGVQYGVRGLGYDPRIFTQTKTNLLTWYCNIYLWSDLLPSILNGRKRGKEKISQNIH